MNSWTVCDKNTLQTIQAGSPENCLPPEARHKKPGNGASKEGTQQPLLLTHLSAYVLLLMFKFNSHIDATRIYL